jgi:hypothetical protein
MKHKRHSWVKIVIQIIIEVPIMALAVTWGTWLGCTRVSLWGSPSGFNACYQGTNIWDLLVAVALVLALNAYIYHPKK